MNESDWVKDLSKKYQSGITEKAQRDLAFLEEQRVRKEYTSSLMSELRAAFERKARLFNSEVQKEILSLEDARGVSNFLLRRNEPPSKIKQFRVHCDAEKYIFDISVLGQTPGILKTLVVNVDQTTGRGYLALDDKPVTPDQVAESTIEELLKEV